MANEFVITERRCEMCKTYCQCGDCEMVMDGKVIARFPLCLGCKKEMEETYKVISTTINRRNAKENKMKATKKPVTIECFKYDGDLINSKGEYYVPDWAAKAYEDGTIFFKDQGEMYIKTLEGDHHASVGDYIIRGVNGELYPCKPDIFEKTYDIDEKTDSVMEAPETTHGFDWAIQRLNAGEKVQRKGWNGKGQYIELATSISYKNAKGEIINCNHDAIGNKALAFVGTSGVQMGWLASQADMLAEDWMIAE